MKLRFFDRQHLSNSLNGCTISDVSQLENILDGLRISEAFFFELEGENGYKLTIGIASTIGCVQHSRIDGELPYLVAVAPTNNTSDDQDQEYVEFLIGNTPTPIPTRNCISLELLKPIAIEFLTTGNRLETIRWEEI
jgi:hypothetical protein